MTPAGRAIGIALMIAGVGIFGIIAASAAAWFISAEQQQDGCQQADTITALTAEITSLRQTVAELSAQVAVQPRQPPRQPARRHTATSPTAAKRRRLPVPGGRHPG